MSSIERDFYRAAVEDDLPTVERLLLRREHEEETSITFNVNARIRYRGRLHDQGVRSWQTALHGAVRQGNVDVVRLLVQHHQVVDLNARNSEGCTPLFVACQNWVMDQAPQLELIRILLQAGADPNASDWYSPDPLFAATLSQSVLAVRALFDAGATINLQTDNFGNTNLHNACIMGGLRAGLITAFLDNDIPAEVWTAQNPRGHTPLDCLLFFCKERIERQDVQSALQGLLQAYGTTVAAQQGPLCIHFILQQAVFIEEEEEEAGDNAGGGGSNNVADNRFQFELPCGKLTTELLQVLLEYLLVLRPRANGTRNNENKLPLQVATQLNFPEAIIYVLLRDDPGALRQLKRTVAGT